MLTSYTMFAACECGEEHFAFGFSVQMVYEPVLAFRREHEALGHTLIHSEDPEQAEEYASRRQAAYESAVEQWTDSIEVVEVDNEYVEVVAPTEKVEK